MRKVALSITVVIPILLSQACAPAAEPGPTVEDTEAAVRAVSEDMIENEVARNFETVGSFYAPDAVFQAANMPLFEGRQAILDAYREFYATVLEMGGEVSEVVASESGELAIEWGTNRIVVESPEGPVELIGKYSRGWKKIDGTWQILIQTYSADVMPPA
jgi:ketosteroid isomerase-like protein